MYAIQKYKQQNHYPQLDSISDIARQKCPPLRDMESKNKTSRTELKQMVGLAILQYISDDLLPLSPTHIKIISDWVVSDYNPETQQGGAMGYSIEDIHMIFRMGTSGQFGKPTGHKYVLPEITGKKGWFEQYENLRNIELGAYYHQMNSKKKEIRLPITAKDIPCPEELKIEHSKILHQERKRYESIQEFCDEKGYNYDEQMAPYIEKWTADFYDANPNGAFINEYISFQKVRMLKRINNAPLNPKPRIQKMKREYKTV